MKKFFLVASGLLLLTLTAFSQASVVRQYDEYGHAREALVSKKGDTLVPFVYNIDGTSYDNYYLIQWEYNSAYSFIHKKTLKTDLDSILSFSIAGNSTVTYTAATKVTDDYDFTYNIHRMGLFDLENAKSLLDPLYSYLYACGKEWVLVTRDYDEKAIYSTSQKKFVSDFEYSSFDCRDYEDILVARLNEEQNYGVEVYGVESGNPLFDHAVDGVETLSNGYLLVNTADHLTGLFNLATNAYELEPGEYDIKKLFVRESRWEDPYYLIEENGKYGLFDPLKNELVFDIIYDRIEKGLKAYPTPLIVGNEGELSFYSATTLKHLAGPYGNISIEGVVPPNPDDYYYGYYDYYDYGYYDSYYNDYYWYGEYSSYHDYGYYDYYDYYGYYDDYDYGYDYGFERYGNGEPMEYYIIEETRNGKTYKGIMNRDLIVELENEYDEVGKVSYDKVSYCADGACGVYTLSTGSFEETGDILITDGAPLDGYYLAKKGEKVGLADRTNYTIVLEPKYVDITRQTDTRESLADDVFIVVEQAGEDEVSYFMNKDFKLLKDKEVRYVIQIVDGDQPHYAYGYEKYNDTWRAGEGVLGPDFKKIGGTYANIEPTHGSNKHFMLRENGLFGIFDIESGKIIYTNENPIDMASENMVAVMMGDNYYYGGYWEDVQFVDLKTGKPLFDKKVFTEVTALDNATYYYDDDTYVISYINTEGIYEVRSRNNGNDEAGYLHCKSGNIWWFEDDYDNLPEFRYSEKDQVYVLEHENYIYYSGYENNYYDYIYFPYESYLLNGDFEEIASYEHAIVSKTSDADYFEVKLGYIDPNSSNSINTYDVFLTDRSGKEYLRTDASGKKTDYIDIEIFNDHFFVREDMYGNWELFDLKGKQKLADMDIDGIVVKQDVVLIEIDDHWGIMDNSFEFIVEPEFYNIETIYGDGGTYYYENGGEESKKILAYKVQDWNYKYYIYDPDFGKSHGPYTYLYQLNGKMWEIQLESSGYGIINVETNEIVVEPVYSYIETLNWSDYSAYKIEKDGYYGVFDVNQRKIVLEPEFTQFEYFWSSAANAYYYKGTKDGYMGLYDEDFNQVLSNNYKGIEALYGNGLFAVQFRDGGSGLVDSQGKVQYQCNYDEISNIETANYDYWNYTYRLEAYDGLYYQTVNNGLKGIMDGEFNEVFEPQFIAMEVLQYEHQNSATAKPRYIALTNGDEKMGITDFDFNWIIEPEYDEVWLDNRTGFWMARIGKVAYMIQYDGTVIKLGDVNR